MPLQAYCCYRLGKFDEVRRHAGWQQQWSAAICSVRFAEVIAAATAAAEHH
jgi:hypothetical protein